MLSEDCYGEILCPKEGVNNTVEEIANGEIEDEDYENMIYSESVNRTSKEERKECFATPSLELYEQLQQIVVDSEIGQFDSVKVTPAGFDYDEADQYYEFYTEYEYGNVLEGFSDDPDECGKFIEAAHKLQEYLDQYIATNS